MNLLIPVVVLVDDILVTEVERLTASGMAIEIIRHTAKATPPKNEQRQLHLAGNNHASFLLLKMIPILY